MLFLYNKLYNQVIKEYYILHKKIIFYSKSIPIKAPWNRLWCL